MKRKERNTRENENHSSLITELLWFLSSTKKIDQKDTLYDMEKVYKKEWIAWVIQRSTISPLRATLFLSSYYQVERKEITDILTAIKIAWNDIEQCQFIISLFKQRRSFRHTIDTSSLYKEFYKWSKVDDQLIKIANCHCYTSEYQIIIDSEINEWWEKIWGWNRYDIYIDAPCGLILSIWNEPVYTIWFTFDQNNTILINQMQKIYYQRVEDFINHWKTTKYYNAQWSMIDLQWVAEKVITLFSQSLWKKEQLIQSGENNEYFWRWLKESIAKKIYDSFALTHWYQFDDISKNFKKKIW